MKKSLEDTSSGQKLFIYSSKEADELRRHIPRVRNDPKETIRYLEKIAFCLLRGINSKLLSSRPIVPVFVLRSGLVLKTPFYRVFDFQPSGLLVPYRVTSNVLPQIVYANVPVLNQGQVYLLLDLIIASGSTMVASIESIEAQLGTKYPDLLSHIFVACPFATAEGIDAIQSKYPKIQIHVLWSNEEINASYRMNSIGFDVGDYVFGGSSYDRFQWVDK